MRFPAIILFCLLGVAAKPQSTFNGDSLFQTFTGEDKPDNGRTKISHYLELLPLRFYDIPRYAYTNAALGTYYLTGGMYKMYFNGIHGVRLGIEINKETYGYLTSTQGSRSSLSGSKKDHYLRYGYERVIGENEHGQLYAAGDVIYISSLANSTKVYHTDTYSDQKHPPVKQLTSYDSTVLLNTNVSAGLLQLGMGGRLFMGNWYISVEMMWGINVYKQEEDYTANAVFTRINLSPGLNYPSYNLTYTGDDESRLKVAFSATYLRIGLGYKF